MWIIEAYANQTNLICEITSIKLDFLFLDVYSEFVEYLKVVEYSWKYFLQEWIIRMENKISRRRSKHSTVLSNIHDWTCIWYLR